MSKIDTAEVKRIAALAKIGLTDNEATAMAGELDQIVEFVETLQSVDTEGVILTNQVTGLTDAWRADEIKPSLDRNELLKNAPEQQDGYIKVRRVLG
jgi:aspartyl-tRNA(Asn)/glutamyl-tRNA(Gln) amidotransferase subunit C